MAGDGSLMGAAVPPQPVVRGLPGWLMPLLQSAALVLVLLGLAFASLPLYLCLPLALLVIWLPRLKKRTPSAAPSEAVDAIGDLTRDLSYTTSHNALSAAGVAYSVKQLAGKLQSQLDAAARDALATQRHRLLPVDEHRRGRRLAGAGQADADVGMLAFAGAVDDAAHHRDLHVLDAGVLAAPDRHGRAQVVVDLLGQFLEGGAGGAATARASGDAGHEHAQAQRLQAVGVDRFQRQRAAFGSRAVCS